jgi:hypothetical protein
MEMLARTILATQFQVFITQTNLAMITMRAPLTLAEVRVGVYLFPKTVMITTHALWTPATM